MLTEIKKSFSSLLNALFKLLPFYHPIVLILANIISPSRLAARLKNNRSTRFRLSPINLRQRSSDLKIKFDHMNRDRSFEIAIDSLKRNGAVVIEGYFSDSQLSEFLEVYREQLETLTSSESRFDPRPPRLTPQLISMWLDPGMLNFMSTYLGTSAYCRSVPAFQYVDNSSTYVNRASKSGVAYPWHIDHCSILPQMIYLADVEERGTAMEILAGTNALPIPAWVHIDGFTIEQDRFPVKRLYGPKGSIQLHDPSVIHRASPVEGSDRLWLYSDFSWGENILFDFERSSQMLSGRELSSFNISDNQRLALSGIFPKMPSKGYEIDSRGHITPQVRQSI
jgi:hypothetical protein